MDKNYAIKLIQDVFQSPFDREQFIAFTKNLFNFLDTERNFIYRGNFIPDAYKPYIHTLERIGKYEDAEDNKIDVLIVHLKKEYSIEHARTMQRNFIAWYLSGSRGGELKDAALVAFHTDNPDDWRFSLVKMDYQIVESETGKIKTKTELTPARRFSFLVGKNENSHTAQRQLLPTLQDDKNNPLLSDFEKAFNIEVVTQEFFERYCGLFLDVKEALEQIITKNPDISQDFTDKGVDPVDFSKKLLGQIVFLYFLQKKGWFGVGRDDNWGTGPKNFLRLLFEKMIADYKNFFNDILEPLFYEALAKERDKDFYSRFNCKIPFLNGGLFDPISDYDWVHTDILLPDDLFSNHVRTKEGDIGTGILDIFDRYNFTVKEDEPLEKEVAVDPEMLGKVFENLLEVKDRKSKGTYYTPREIVHYMCQESLINYLVNECEGKVGRKDIETLIQYGESAVEHDGRVEQEGKETLTYSYKLPENIRKNAQLIDDKLKNIRVCDPAIGSGAFPVGMMNEIIRTRNTLTNYLEDKTDRSIYNFKRDTIQNSLYGVDIDPGAVEIAKLRLWLSLVVDEQDIKQIKPLPNLDYKIMQGNSLLEEFEGVWLFDDRLLNSYIPTNDDQIKKLEAREKEIQKNLMIYYQKNPLWMKNQKIERPTELYQFEGELKRVHLAIKDEKGIRFQIKDSNQNALFGDEQKARKIWEELQSLQKEFFETTQKKEKDELKKQVEKLEWELIEATLKEEKKESSLKKLEQYKRANIKPFFLWKLHFSEVFQEKGGFDVVIGNPPYIDSEGMVKNGQGDIREAIQKSYKWTRGNWDIYIAFFELGFKELNQNGTLTFITPDKWISKPFGDEFRKGIIDNIFILLRAGRKVFASAKVDSIISFFTKQKHGKLKVVDFVNKEFILIREIDKKSLLSPFTLDHLFSDKLDLLLKIGGLKHRLSDLSISENACATSDAYKLKPLIFDLKVDSFNPAQHLKIINTGTISKYHSKWGEREMTYLGNKYLFPVVDKEKFLTTFKNSYANKSVQPKIAIKGLNLLDGCLDDEGFIIPGKTTLIIVDSDIKKLKFLLAVVNSRLSIFYIKERYSASSYNQGIGFTKDMINNLPIPEISDVSKKEVIDLVDKILAITKPVLPAGRFNDYSTNSTKQSQAQDYEKQIDQLVYQLYGLSSEEKKIVENLNS